VNEIVSGTAPIGVLLDSRFPDANRQLRELQDTAGATSDRSLQSE
jgi:hypothetical protein